MKNYDTAGEIIKELGLKAQPAGEFELAFTADWLESYELDIEDTETAQKIANAVGFVMRALENKVKARKLAEAKRAFAEANGLKVSQVRVRKGGN